MDQSNKDDIQLLNKLLATVEKGDFSVLESLSHKERGLILDILREIDSGAVSPILDMLWDMDYREKPVDVGTFVTDPYYLGLSVGSGSDDDVYPAWFEVLQEAFDPNKTDPIVELIFSGSIGTGKCVVGDTLIPTNEGFLKMQDLVKDKGTGILVQSHQGRNRMVTAVYDQGVSPTIKIRTEKGYSLEGREDHKIIRLHDGGLNWCRLQDLQEGDMVAVEYGTNLWGMEHLPVEHAEAHGSWLIARASNDLSIEFKGATDGGVPPVILKSDYETVCAFFRGLAEMGAIMSEDGESLLLCLDTELAADQIQQLLLNLGFLSEKCEVFQADFAETTLGWSLNISGADNVNDFLARIHAPLMRDDEFDPTLVEDTMPRRDVALLEVKSKESAVGHCYDITVDEDHSYVANGFLSHNTTIAALAFTYAIYKLSCLRNPQKFYGLMPDHRIAFGLYNVFKYKVESTSYSYVENYVKNSPYFRENFPRDPRKTKALEFPNNISVLHGSRELDAIGENLFAVLIDETDFMKSGADEDEKGQAYRIYTSTRRRMESRFMQKGGSIPGLLIMISSKTHKGSFIENRIQDYKDDPKVYVADKCLWEVKPWKYSGKKFPVYIGDHYNDPYLIPDGSAGEEKFKGKIIWVPTEHKQAFHEDLDAALRDIAGVATVSDLPFIPSREHIHSCVDESRFHPFTKMEFSVTVDDDLSIEDFFKPKDILNIRSSVYGPKINPSAERFVHIDLAITQDSVGIAMGHIAGFRDVERAVPSPEEDEHGGFTYTSRAPLIYTDLVLRVKPTPGSRIDFQKIRDFIYALKTYGFPIKTVTLDGYNSEDSVQQFNKQGIDSSIVSVDRPPTSKKGHPYTYLKQAIMEDRISYYYYPHLLAELVALQKVDLKGGFDPKNRWKVDHPQTMLDLKGNKVRGCFSGDTRVKLLDGTNPTLKELSESWDGTPIYLYTVDGQGRITVGEAVNPRLTHKDADTIIITLDTGEEITCTPDHRFMLRDGSYKEAKDLTPEDSLMSLVTRKVASEIRNGPKIDVYDISVPGTENFALSSGVFVHNSKDISDALAAMCFMCMTSPGAHIESALPMTAKDTVKGNSKRLSNSRWVVDDDYDDFDRIQGIMD